MRTAPLNKDAFVSITERFEMLDAQVLSVNSSAGAHASKPVEQLDKDGNVIAVFGSINKAARAVGTTSGNISKVCKGETVTSKGFGWRFGKSADTDVILEPTPADIVMPILEPAQEPSFAVGEHNPVQTLRTSLVNIGEEDKNVIATSNVLSQMGVPMKATRDNVIIRTALSRLGLFEDSVVKGSYVPREEIRSLFRNKHGKYSMLSDKVTDFKVKNKSGIFLELSKLSLLDECIERRNNYLEKTRVQSSLLVGLFIESFMLELKTNGEDPSEARKNILWENANTDAKHMISEGLADNDLIVAEQLIADGEAMMEQFNGEA